MIEQREQQELETKRKEAAALKATWSEQLTVPKNQVAKMADPVKPEECGLSALQGFAGEDVNGYSRQCLQKAQIKSWAKQQMAERQAKAIEEADEMKRYEVGSTEHAISVKPASGLIDDNTPALALCPLIRSATPRPRQVRAILGDDWRPKSGAGGRGGRRCEEAGDGTQGVERHDQLCISIAKI